MTRTQTSIPVLRMRAVQSRNSQHTRLALLWAVGTIVTPGGHGLLH